MKPIWPKMLRIGDNEWFAWNEDQAEYAVRLVRAVVALVDYGYALTKVER